jgi:osmotically-inducible protein OsmY
MVRRVRIWVIPVVGMTVLAAGLATRAQEQQPPQTTTGKIKAKVDSAVESLKKGATSAEEAIRQQFAKAKNTVAGMGVEARVYGRLHWDKALTGSKIELSALRPGVIALSGTVANAKAKAKALELTTDTVGVTEVVDHLTIQSTATTTTPGTPRP